MMINENDFKYAIARKYYGSKSSYDFISSLAHEFAGKKEVIGYLDLSNALYYDTQEQAENILKSQPEWVRNSHIVIPFEKLPWGCFLNNKKSKL